MGGPVRSGRSPRSGGARRGPARGFVPIPGVDQQPEPPDVQDPQLIHLAGALLPPDSSTGHLPADEVVLEAARELVGPEVDVDPVPSITIETSSWVPSRDHPTGSPLPPCGPIGFRRGSRGRNRWERLPSGSRDPPP